MSDVDKVTRLMESQSGRHTEKTLSFNPELESDWAEPPINKTLGYILPTDHTYHPLLNSDNAEILENIFTVDSSSRPAEEKKRITDQIKRIVKEAPTIKAWGSIYFSSIIFAIFLLLLIILLVSYWILSSPLFLYLVSCHDSTLVR